MMGKGGGRSKFTNLAKVLLLRLYVFSSNGSIPAISIAKCTGRLGGCTDCVVTQRTWRSYWDWIISYANSSSSRRVVIRWFIPNNNGSRDIMDVSHISYHVGDGGRRG